MSTVAKRSVWEETVDLRERRRERRMTCMREDGAYTAQWEVARMKKLSARPLLLYDVRHYIVAT